MRYCLRDIISHNLVLVVFLLCLFWPEDCRAEAASPTLDFIHVDANIGEAAGGHSAIRLGDLVFHYQFFSENRFFLVRDSWYHFKKVYTDFRNRSLHVASLPVSSQTFTLLKNHFTELLLTQQRHCTREEQLRQQLALVRQLQNRAGRIWLPCVGLFDSSSSGNATMLGLGRQLEQALGRGALARMLLENRNQVVALLNSSERGTPAWGASLHKAFLLQEFVRLVLRGATLAPEAVITLPDFPVLSSEERLLLTCYQSKLAASVIRLAGARRPGQEKALVVQAARYMVISTSLVTGKLVTLNPFSASVVKLTVPEERDYEPLRALCANNVRRARNEFFTSDHQDISWARLETAAGRYYATLVAPRTGELPALSGFILPSRKGQVSIAWLPENSFDLSGKRVDLASSLYQLNKKIAALYRYDLVEKNCATELLHAINTAFTDPATGRESLGGWLQTESAGVFIPAWLHRQVRSVFPVEKDIYLPSYRLRALARQYTGKNDLLVWLRESNVLSATLYRPQLEDSAFLFFTDDQILPRPVLGAANLVWGGLYTALGIVLSPFDRGEQFVQGIRGMFYSVPELFFGNIRKGTYAPGNTVSASP